jgi:two-component system, OmpR family, KDP operon response regulator KdpE
MRPTEDLVDGQGRHSDTEMSDSPVHDICLLLVEDDELNRALVRTILARSADPMLRTAWLIETGDLARSRVVLADTAVDLVLLDMRLPDGSGLDLAAELKQSGAQGAPIVVALTGAAEPQLRSAALAAGCAAVLAKPYLAADLRDLLTAQLRRRRAQSGRDREHRCVTTSSN